LLQTFNLVPYPAEALPNVKIAGALERTQNQLSIQYELQGEIEQIVFPRISPFPVRADDLWKATCFEFFIAIPNQPQYWEFNLSPSGDWNIYIMDAYRRVGFREENRIGQLPFQFNKNKLELSIDLKHLFPESQKLQIGITAIIQTTNGIETYWALTHPGPQADFHLRESFTLTI
jgi:hypothetical protein